MAYQRRSEEKPVDRCLLVVHECEDGVKGICLLKPSHTGPCKCSICGKPKPPDKEHSGTPVIRKNHKPHMTRQDE